MPAPDGQRAGEAPATGGEPAEEDPLAGAFYEPNVNQRRHEPMPASPDDEREQEAVRQNEAFAHGYEAAEAPEGQGEVPGHVMPGPEDPRTPPAHVTGAEPAEGRVGRVRQVSRAARGKPDGEVDPHG
jgi:hypothetical protein